MNIKFKNNNPPDRIYGNIISFIFVSCLAVIFSPCSNAQDTGSAQTFGEEFQVKRFYSSTIDEDNNIWFLTEKGIVSYDGAKWALHNRNRKVTSTDLKDMIYDFSSYGPELWIATPRGATVASLPVDARSGA
ncbi:MAG: hypothetical protein WCE64_13275, partial [Bacteroidales bacterium]